MIKNPYPPIPDLCHCGCGSIVYGGRKFSRGHNKSFLGKSHTKDSRIKISNSWIYEKHFTENTLKKMSASAINSDNSGRFKKGNIPKKCFKKGNIPHNKGRSWDEKTLKKITDSNRERAKRSNYVNPMKGKKRPDVSELISNLHRLWQENPDLHPNRIMAKKGFISKPQLKLFEIIRQHFPDAELEYPIRTPFGLRFADVGVQSLKTDFEYNGEYWHKGHEDEDQRRTLEIEESGWNVVIITEENVRGLW